jgi:hypothetical protein
MVSTGLTMEQAWDRLRQECRRPRPAHRRYRRRSPVVLQASLDRSAEGAAGLDDGAGDEPGAGAEPHLRINDGGGAGEDEGPPPARISQISPAHDDAKTRRQPDGHK